MITEVLIPNCPCPAQSPVIIHPAPYIHVDLAGNKAEVQWHPTKIICRNCGNRWRVKLMSGNRELGASNEEMQGPERSRIGTAPEGQAGTGGWVEREPDTGQYDAQEQGTKDEDQQHP